MLLVVSMVKPADPASGMSVAVGTGAVGGADVADVEQAATSHEALSKPASLMRKPGKETVICMMTSISTYSRPLWPSISTEYVAVNSGQNCDFQIYMDDVTQVRLTAAR